VKMRPVNRRQMPDMGQILKEANELLLEARLPTCHCLAPVDDLDTANPNVIGLAADRRYAIKVCLRHPEAIEEQARLANRIVETTGLPIPRHYAGAPREGRLPLVVMEWMPGEQLRVLLPATERPLAAVLAQDWGRCVGILHRATIADEGIVSTHATFIHWLRDRVDHDLARLGSSETTFTPGVQVVREWMGERSEAIQTPGLWGLTKADMDVRDFLGIVEPRPHVCAMLDWEAVRYMDCLWNLASICVRLHLMNLLHLWAAFLTGYEDGGAFRWLPSPAAEYYLAGRTIVAAASGQAHAAKLLGALVAGDQWPFVHG
jgi:hypothetical protein